MTRRLSVAVVFGAWLLCMSGAAQASLQVVICEGLGGESAYAEQFAAQVDSVKRAASTVTDPQHVKVLDGRNCTRDAFSAVLKQLAGSLVADDRLALYLIGHGSFDGEQYRFNIPGPDFTGHELQFWLGSLHARDQLVVVTGSSSGALQELLKAPSRIVITATRNGSERNATRFGSEFAAALSDATADTDKNGSVSVQEAFDFAQRRVQAFYERDVRIASEHAVLGGAQAASVTIARLSSAAHSAAAGSEGDAAAARVDSPERRRIVEAIEGLRLRKADLPESEYDAQLEALLLQLATLDATAVGAGGAEVPR